MRMLWPVAHLLDVGEDEEMDIAREKMKEVEFWRNNYWNIENYPM